MYTPKTISGPEKQRLINLSGDDLRVSRLTKMFGWTAKKVNGKMVRIPPEYNVMDLVHLDAGEYINVEAVDTTVGSVLWNKLFSEGTVHECIPNHYFNEVVTAKVFGKFLGYIEEALKKGTLPIEPNLISFIDNYEFYSMKLVTMFSPSYTQALFQTDPRVRAKREELLNKLGDERTLEDMVKTEDELVAYAKEILKNDDGLTLFDSGARGSFDNDYKNMNLMVGAVKNESDGSYDFISHGYLDGMTKDEWIAAGNMAVNAAYPKAVNSSCNLEQSRLQILVNCWETLFKGDQQRSILEFIIGRKNN